MRPTVEKALRACVTITGNSSVGFSFGSGVIIAPGKILTARHVVENENGTPLSNLKITYHNGSCRMFRPDFPYSDKIITRKRPDGRYLQDVAIIEIPLMNDFGSYPAPATPEFGDPCFTIGNPGNFGLTYMDGCIGSLAPSWHEGGDPTFLAVLPIRPGNSGGGVFIERNNDVFVVGVVVANQTQNPSVGGRIIQIPTEMSFVEPYWDGK